MLIISFSNKPSVIKSCSGCTSRKSVLAVPTAQAFTCRKPRMYIKSQHRRQGRRCSCSDGESEALEGTALASKFSQHINETGFRRPLEHRRPTPMLPPTAVVAAQLDALQMNDWPDNDAGVRTAFLFSKPYDCENLIAGQASPSQCHSWQGRETWLSFKDFSNALHSPPMNVLLNCESWKAVSAMKFPSQRCGNRAVQAVEVIASTQQDAAQPRTYTFTFCLERIDVGPYKGCWMTVGLRSGNYSV